MFRRLKVYQNDQCERNRIYHGVDLSNVDINQVKNEINYDTQFLDGKVNEQQTPISGSNNR